jgi:hypothetical protein
MKQIRPRKKNWLEFYGRNPILVWRKGRDIYGFWKIPYGETTGGENRFQPPIPRAPLNDGKVR